MYFEDENYDVYTVDHPESLKRPWTPPAAAPANAQVAVAPLPTEAPVARPDSQSAGGAVQQGVSIYRTDRGFREAGQAGADSAAPQPVSIRAMLDSTPVPLPDTSDFTIRKYRPKFTPDYVARPVVGYSRDTFGRGFFGGTAIALSDMLSDRTMIFSGYVNGSLVESQILAAYINLSRRINWAAGVSQDPYFYLEASEIRRDPSPAAIDTLVTNVRRLVVRQAFTEAYYPFNRFSRLEAGMRVANVTDDRLSILEPFDGFSGFSAGDAQLKTTGLGSVNYLQPSLALVFDNSLLGYVGPFYGRSMRLGVSQTVGSWRFTTLQADYRRYDHIVGPFTLATRALYYGRIGRDANQFQLFLGSTDLLRGNTSGSYIRNECRNANDFGTQTGCAALDRLIGSQIAVGSAELRFPVLNSRMFHWLPLGFPPLEGALFYDVGLAWNDNSVLRLSLKNNPDPLRYRTPLQTWGASLRTNLFNLLVLRLDYSIPINRAAVKGLWTISLGPTF